MRPIIKAEGVSKEYRIGGRKEEYPTLRDAMAAALRAPLRRARRGGDARQFWALKDVSFDVTPGEVVGIIGRNGAGKSTLLKVLSRITEPTAGRIELYGRVSSLLEVGTGFHPELTGRENIYLNGSILGMTRREIRRDFDEIVAFSEIEKFLDTPVKRYSSGMYVRLAFAVAAHLKPEILIVDEVLAVGDAQFQKKCIGKMGSIAKEGRTVLFVSHNMDAVSKLCGRGVLLERGRVTTTGTAEEVATRYVEGGAEARSSYDIEPPPESEDAPGHAYRLTVEDEYGNPAVAVPVGRPWQMRVRFRVTRRTEHFVIGLGLRTPMEVAVRTSWSAPRTLEPGEYEAVFREESVWFGAGRYSVQVGLSAYERAFHYADAAGVLELAEYSQGLNVMKVSGVGIVLNPLRVEIERVGAAQREAGE